MMLLDHMNEYSAVFLKNQQQKKKFILVENLQN